MIEPVEPQGSIVIDEFIFPVVGVVLQEGMFVVYGKITGPHKSVRGRYRLHSSDGQIVYTSEDIATTPDLSDDDDCILTLAAEVVGGLAATESGGQE